MELRQLRYFVRIIETGSMEAVLGAIPTLT